MGTNGVAVARSCLVIAYFSWEARNQWPGLRREDYSLKRNTTADMKKLIQTPALRPNPAHQLRPQLAAKIASLIGNEENRITEIPGLSLHRRTAPTPPCRTTYHPGIIVVAQGSKQVNLGKSSFIYDEAH